MASEGNANTTTAEIRNVTPALLANKVRINENSLAFILTAIPMNNNTRGAMMVLKLVIVFPRKSGRLERFKPNANNSSAIIMTRLIGSFNSDKTKPFSLFFMEVLASLMLLMLYQCIASMYNMISTNILLPTSARADKAK